MTINISDYSKTAADRGWGAGWPSCSGILTSGGTAIVTTKRSGTRISVHKRMARLVLMLLDWTEDPAGGNYLLLPGQCGGYNCRNIAGTSVPSNHSWGLAVDLNWNQNTYNATGIHTMPTAVARKWNEYGFAYGGDYTGMMHDWMHLEFMGSPADADAMTAKALAQLGSSTPTATTHAKEDPVSAIALNIGTDGRFHELAEAECGDSSLVVARAFVAVGAAYGSAHVVITALGATTPLKQWTYDIASNGRVSVELPNGTVQFTVEGNINGPSTRVGCALINLAK